MLSRFYKVRTLGPAGYGLPYMLDYRQGTVEPYTCDEWWQHPKTRAWCPVLQGGVGYEGTYEMNGPGLGIAMDTAGTPQTLALSSAYVSGSAGNSSSARWKPVANITVTDLYFFISSYVGTAANVNDLECEIRSGTISAVTAGAPGLIASSSASLNPASALGWIKFTGLSAALTAGTYYYFILRDADGNGTDHAVIMDRHTGGFANTQSDRFRMVSVTTANGYSTLTAQTRTASVVLVFSTGRVLGMPLSAVAGATSSTNRKGFFLSTGIREATKIHGIATNNPHNSILSAEIIDGTALPGGATLGPSSVQTTSYSTTIIGVMFSPFTLQKSTPYRVVMTYGGACTSPNKITIGTGTDANLRAAMLGGGGWYWAEANGTTDWSNDDISAFPYACLLVEDQFEVSGPGGTRMRGGFVN